MSLKNKKSSSKVSKWIVFTSMPMQMAATIYLFYLIGDWLDTRDAIEEGWCVKGMTMLGVFSSVYQFVRQAKRMSNNE